MDQFSGAVPFWDISQTPNSISQLPDDDFLTLLQKQFPVSNNSFSFSFPGYNTNTGVNPQSLTNPPFPPPHGVSPPSSDSSPSPPSADTDPGSSRRQSTSLPDREDSTLKRKASDDDMDFEQSHKSAHTDLTPATSAVSVSLKKSSSRRKSGNPSQDEVRLMKRKEQNRAAQRAFRERKEKHVKDLEDKVASLEARNQRTESENDNLRDLLSRLQDENVRLKQQAFTFSVEKDQTGHFSSSSAIASATTTKSPSQESSFGSSSSGSSKFPMPASPRFLTPNSNSEFNFGSLIPFDPAVLNALDNGQSTGPEESMNLDFGFGKECKATFNILASDPMYTSFAESFASSFASDITSPFSNSYGNFDLSSLDSWSRPDSQPNIVNGGSMQTLDELVGGDNFLGVQSGTGFSSSFLKNASSAPTVSPVIHAASQPVGNHSPPSSTTECTSKSRVMCPLTKSGMLEKIVKDGPSMFVEGHDSSSTSSHVGSDAEAGQQSTLRKEPESVLCRGSSFPKTEKNDNNVEVLRAWKCITSNPQFKDVDINELCTEFTDKAKCDGTKVVLEPEGVHSILESLNAKCQKQLAQRA